MTWHAVPWAPGLDIELAVRFDGTNWEDVTTDLRTFTTSVSRSRALGVYPPGTASFNLNNRHGNYAPLNTSGPHYGEILPGRHIRFRTRYGGDEFDVWYGIVKDWGDAYPQAKDGIATIAASQPTYLLSSWEGPASIVEVGEGELTGERINRVLTASGFPMASSVDAGIFRMQATTLTADGFSLVSEAVDLEMGALWCGPNGYLYFEHRHALALNVRSTNSQVTFGNGGGAEVPYLADPPPPMSSGLDLVTNQYTAGLVGSDVTYTETDSASVAALDATFSDRNSSLKGETGGSPYAYANAIGHLYLYADPYSYPTSISLLPASAPTVSWDQAFGRSIRDKVTVKVPTPWGTTYSCPVWIVGISHAVSPREGWVTTFEFEPANALVSSGFGVAGTAIVGTTKVAY